MFFGIVVATLALFPSISVFAAPVPHFALDTHLHQRAPLSVVSLFATAQSRMDQVLAQAGGSAPMDLTSLNNIISTANDVSDTLATGLQTVDPKLTTLMVDITGNKLTDEEFAAKVSALLKSFETACSTAKDANSGEIGDVIQLIALNVEDMNDELRRVTPNVAQHPLVTDSSAHALDSMSKLVDDIFGPE